MVQQFLLGLLVVMASVAFEGFSSRSQRVCSSVRFLATVTTARAKMTGAAASVERRRREPDRAISLE